MDANPPPSAGPAIKQPSWDTHPGFYRFWAGPAAATVGIGFLLQPVQNTLIRIKADYRPLDPSGQGPDKRSGVWALVKRVWKQEGRFHGTYRGWLPTLLMYVEAMAVPAIQKAVEGTRFEWDTAKLLFPTMLLRGLPSDYLQLVMTRAILSRYVPPARGSARSIWSLPSRNVLLIDLCVRIFRYALMAFRTRFLFPLSDETRFCVSLLGQGQMGVAKWAGWAVILVAALVITSPLEIARIRLIAQDSTPFNGPDVASDADIKDDSAPPSAAEPGALVQLRPSTFRPYTSPVDAVRTIYAEEGWQALFATWQWSAILSAMDLIL